MSEGAEPIWPAGVKVEPVQTAATSGFSPEVGFEFDPVWVVIILMGLIFYYLRRLPKTNVERDWTIQGRHYLGRITPKLLKSIQETEELRALRKERTLSLRKHGAYLLGRKKQPKEEASALSTDATIRRR